MIKIEFTPEEIDALEYERYHYPDPKVQKKMEAVYLKSQGIAHQEICRLGRMRIPVKSSTESGHAVQWRREATLVRGL